MPLAIIQILIVRGQLLHHPHWFPAATRTRDLACVSRLRAHDEKASRVLHRPAHNTVMWDNHQRDWDHKPYRIKHLHFFLQFCLSNHSHVVVALRPQRSRSDDYRALSELPEAEVRG
jgi:hypothetical protein